MMGCVTKLKRLGITRIRIMRPPSKDIVDPRLDAEDCTHHCPMWFILSLATVGAVSATGCFFFGSACASGELQAGRYHVLLIPQHRGPLQFIHVFPECHGEEAAKDVHLQILSFVDWAGIP